MNCNFGPDTVKPHQCQAGHVLISTCRFVFDQDREGEAQCERTADKPPFIQTSVITALCFALLFLVHSFFFLCLSQHFAVYSWFTLYSYTPYIPHVHLQVISGSNLPVPRGGKGLDPFVRVEIHGISSDTRRKNTRTVRNNCEYCSKLYRVLASTVHLWMTCQTFIWSKPARHSFMSSA